MLARTTTTGLVARLAFYAQMEKHQLWERPPVFQHRALRDFLQHTRWQTQTARHLRAVDPQVTSARSLAILDMKQSECTCAFLMDALLAAAASPALAPLGLAYPTLEPSVQEQPETSVPTVATAALSRWVGERAPAVELSSAAFVPRVQPGMPEFLFVLSVAMGTNRAARSAIACHAVQGQLARRVCAHSVHLVQPQTPFATGVSNACLPQRAHMVSVAPDV